MLYLNLSDSAVEVIQTKKRLLGREKIVACSRREIPEGLIINGVIVDSERLITHVKDIFSSGYPHIIKDKTVSLIISDTQAVHSRFLIEGERQNTDTVKLIIEEVKKILPGEVTEFEHFYKGIKPTQSSQEILYTAASRITIVHFAKFLNLLGLKLIFLSSRSFALYEMIKFFIQKDETILYCDIDKKTTAYFIYDQYGPLNYLDKKSCAKTFTSDIKNIISKLDEENKLKVTKIILGGIGSIEITASELTDALGAPVLKMGEIIEKVIHKHKLTFDAGGTSYMLYANVLGQYLLGRNKAAPNFAKDLDIFMDTHSGILDRNIASFQKTDEIEETKNISIAGVENEEKSNVADQMMQKKRSGIFNLLKSKIIITVGIALLVFGVTLGLFSFLRSGEDGSIPFISRPTATPTLTLTPTITPTPTIDPSLKRSNLKISVQNGTGKTGYAKEIASFLEEKEYKNVAKSNADKDDYEKSIIKIKNDIKNYLPLLVKDIVDKFDTSTIETLDENDKYDVIIILGQK